MSDRGAAMSDSFTVNSVEGERIALTDMADALQCRKQSLFKIAKRLGIVPIMQRDVDRKNQLVSTVIRVEALAIQREFLSRTRTGGPDETPEVEPLISEEGVFYFVQLEPDHDPDRFKVGFTTDLEGRLRKHRCAAPFARCIASWPCRRTWERAAIDCITQGLEQLHTEVFRGPLGQASGRAEQFFSMMPSCSASIENEEQKS